MTPQEERRLVAALLDPDALSWDEWDALVAHHIVPLAWRWAKTEFDLDDLKAVAALAAIRAAKLWDPDQGPFRPYMATAVKNAVRREAVRLSNPLHVSESEFRVATVAPDDLPQEPPEEPWEPVTCQDPLEEALDRADLTPRQREAIKARLDGPDGGLLPFAEVARQLGMSSAGSAANLVHRGVRQLIEAGALAD